MLNGIAQGRPGQSGGIFFQERGQNRAFPFAYFAEHPPYGLVHQVMLVRHEMFGQADRIIKLPIIYKGIGRYHRYALFPKQRSLRQTIKGTPIGMVQQITAHDGRAAQIHQIPIVAPLCMLKVEMINLLALLLAGFLPFETFHQNQQSTEPYFMPRTFQKNMQILKRSIYMRFGHPACLGDRNPQKTIALAIFPFTRLEELA